MRHVSVQAVTQHPHHENGQRIKRARQRVPGPNGRPWISQQDFAPLIGASRRHVIRLENGEHLPGADLRDRIVAVTGTEEQIDSDDDEEEDMLRDLLDVLARMRAKRRETGDPYAVVA